MCLPFIWCLQMNRQFTVSNVLLGKDTFGVTVFPHVDFVFIAALVVILDEIHRERSDWGTHQAQAYFTMLQHVIYCHKLLSTAFSHVFEGFACICPIIQARSTIELCCLVLCQRLQYCVLIYFFLWVLRAVLWFRWLVCMYSVMEPELSVLRKECTDLFGLRWPAHGPLKWPNQLIRPF